MSDIIIFGIGEISEIVDFYIGQDTDHKVVAFTVDKDFITADQFKGRPVVAFEDLETQYPPGRVKLLIPISYKKLNKLREEKYLEAKRRGYEFISYISPKATYYDTPVGENTIIFEDNTIQPFTEIGNNVILWSGNHIGHHSKIEDSCFIASHVVISGAVTIGERCFIGVNATVHDNVKIGKDCIIGASAIAAKDLPDFSILRPAQSSVSDKKTFDLKDF